MNTAEERNPPVHWLPWRAARDVERECTCGRDHESDEETVELGAEDRTDFLRSLCTGGAWVVSQLSL